MCYNLCMKETAPKQKENVLEEIKRAKEKLSRVYKLTIGDGLGETKALKMTGWDIFRMVENSLITGFNASQQIEGEPSLEMGELEHLRCQDPVIMADRLDSIIKIWSGTPE